MLVASRCLRSVSVAARRRLLPVPTVHEVTASRTFATTTTTRRDDDDSIRDAAHPKQESIESYVRSVRDEWGSHLPEGLLSQREYEVYERYYGAPLRMLKPGEELELLKDEGGETPRGTVILEDAEGVAIESVEEMFLAGGGETEPVRVESEEEARAYKQLEKDMRRSFNLAEREDTEEGLTAEEEREESGSEDKNQGGYNSRTHPLTELGRFATHPYTVEAPAFITRPTEALLSDVSNKHLVKATHAILGGPKLSHGFLMTKTSSKTERNIPLDTSHPMSDMEANVFLATALPGYYAQTLGALTELRRRMGGDWVFGPADAKPTEKRVLDIGTGGAGVMAWRSIVEAEQALREEEASEIDGIEPTPVEAKTTEEQVSPGGLKATVVMGSEPLRFRMTKFLDNTTFIPRLPDVNPDTTPTPSSSTNTSKQQPRKLYDLIIATNTLLPIHEDFKRKAHVQKLWSLLNPEGGVLLLVEKGSPYGFEAIAGARSSLLRHNISTTDSQHKPLVPEADDISTPHTPKETASIIAPCTNHFECPLYIHGPGKLMRRDYCSFSQRYERPGYLQRILNARTSNHEDLQYSYIAVQRGIDVTALPVGEEAIDPKVEEFDTTCSPPRSPYSIQQLRRHAHTLPRAIFPTMKRHGHVILDVCTPAGQIERWTVPRSYGKEAYRDARKSRWGDLWALGAKTKILRNLDVGMHLKGYFRNKTRYVVDPVEEQMRDELRGGGPQEKKKNHNKNRGDGGKEKERWEVKKERRVNKKKKARSLMMGGSASEGLI
jgi:ribosomal protein RSM22 (predicted rRNA methylase)